MSLAESAPPMVDEPNNSSALNRQTRRENRHILGLSVPGLLVIFVILFVPVGWLFWLSFLDTAGEFTLANYQRMMRSGYVRTFRTTFEVAAVVTGACILIGYPLTYFMAHLPRRWAAVALMAVLLPFWTSILVRTYAWLVLLQHTGVINTVLINWGLIEEPLPLAHNFTGTVIGMTHILLPFLVLPLYATMKSINFDFMKAAANCGATPLKAFWQIYFPLSLPGLAAGVTLVFVLCLGFFVTPAVLGGGKVPMWAMRIETNLLLYSNWGAASALGVVLLIVTLLVLWVFARLFKLDALYRR